MSHYYTAACFTATMITYHTGRLLKKLTPIVAKDASPLIHEMGAMMQGRNSYHAPTDFINKYGYEVAQFIYTKVIECSYEEGDVVNVSDTSALSFKMAENLLNLDKYIPVMHSAAFGVDIWQYLQISYYMEIIANYKKSVEHFWRLGRLRGNGLLTLQRKN